MHAFSLISALFLIAASAIQALTISSPANNGVFNRGSIISLLVVNDGSETFTTATVNFVSAGVVGGTFSQVVTVGSSLTLTLPSNLVGFTSLTAVSGATSSATININILSFIPPYVPCYNPCYNPCVRPCPPRCPPRCRVPSCRRYDENGAEIVSEFIEGEEQVAQEEGEQVVAVAAEESQVAAA